MLAPVKWLTGALGRLGDRAFLVAQMTAYSLIPFKVYDVLRWRFTACIAFIAALAAHCDPFGLRWAHFQLPGWLIALATVTAMWLASLTWAASPRRRLLLVGVASALLGIMCFARLNYAPLVAVY